MNCTDVKRLLHEEPQAGRVDGSVRAHVASCGACQQVQKQLEVMQLALAEQPLPELPSGFEFELRGRLMAEAAKQEVREVAATQQRRSRRFAVVAMVAAAAVLLVASAAIFWTALQPEGAANYHRLQLSIKSLQVHPAAQMELELPAGVELMPDAAAVLGKGKTVRWRSKLARGVNSIALPLRTMAGVQKAKVTVRLKVGERSLARSVELQGGVARLDGQPGVKLAWVVDLGSQEVVR